MLYNYTQSTYQFKKIIDNLTLVFGLILLVFIFLGFFFPQGKLSIIFMVIPVQITYFTVFQYDQIPLTLSGFDNLQYSNGFNQITSLTDSVQTFSIIKLRSDEMFTNYNLTFLILCMVPFTLGLISYLIVKLI